jgi:histidine triad (HIT) family protein
LFCKFVTGELATDVVAESDSSFAFRDINPQAPTHVLVVPRNHYANVAELAAASASETAGVFQLAAEVAKREGIADSGYRMVANTGPAAGQTVFHTHIHVLGGVSMSWPA